MDRIEHLLGNIDEFHGRRRSLVTQRIDFQSCAISFDGCVRLAVDQKAARDEPVDVAGGFGDKIGCTIDFRFVTADGRVEITVIIRRQDQVFSTLALVRTGYAHIRDKPEIGIIDGRRSLSFRHLDHDRTVPFQIQDRGAVNRIGIARQEQRI